MAYGVTNLLHIATSFRNNPAVSLHRRPSTLAAMTVTASCRSTLAGSTSARSKVGSHEDVSSV